MQLIRSRRIGPATFAKLLAEYGAASAALNALPDIAATSGARDYTACPRDIALREYEAGKAKEARLIALGSADYPAHLAQIDNAPPLLWCIGDLTLLARPSIAIVGARNASALGNRMARTLAQDLGAAGLVVTSGLARGIDAAAHEAALTTGTIAVLAGGVDVTYPRENAPLAQSIRAEGLCLSEAPIGLTPQARHFPQRNRLISGLAQGLVVVEAALKSGSLITARDALDQGRDVMAVPGHPFDARSGGTNQLLKDGAILVRGADDVLTALPPLHPPRQTPTNQLPPDRPAAQLQQQILSLLSSAPCDEGLLHEQLNAPTAQLSQALSELELAGKIERQHGGQILPASSSGSN